MWVLDAFLCCLRWSCLYSVAARVFLAIFDTFSWPQFAFERL